MRLTIRLLERMIVFLALWWVLAEGDASSWLFGVPFSLLASVAALSLTPTRRWRIRPLKALRFAAFFVYNSVVGGIDVAARAIRPSMPITPGFVTYPVRLPTEAARVLLADTVSLLPGTLSSGFEGEDLILHVLDVTAPVHEEVARVEYQIAGALGLKLDPVGQQPAEIRARGEEEGAHA